MKSEGAKSWFPMSNQSGKPDCRILVILEIWQSGFFVFYVRDNRDNCNRCDKEYFMKRNNESPNRHNWAGYQSNEKFMTAYEVRKFLRIPLSTLYDLTRSGRIKAIKIGRHWRYLRDDIERYLISGANYSGKERFLEDPERRNYPRINCSISASLFVSISDIKDIKMDGNILNIGEGGVFVKDCNNLGLFSEIKSDDPITAGFSLEKRMIYASGRVVRRQDNGIVIKFRKMSEDVRKIITEYVG